MTTEQPCRWGILSTAEIAQKNWRAIFHAENATVAAVASRDAAKSEQFIALCQAEAPFPTRPKALGSYQELLEDPHVDAVYIPLPTGLRKEWAVKAARAGKHVLLEKPCGVSCGELNEILDACRQSNVQFMDGTMLMHSARLAHLRAVLDDTTRFGVMRRICVHNCFNGPQAFFENNIRLHSELEPMGCLGDLGWYTARITLWAMQWKLPERVSARVLTPFQQPGSPESVPIEFSAEMQFADGVSSSFYCSFITENQQWVNFGGTRGFAQVQDFVLPYFGSSLQFVRSRATFKIDGTLFNMEPSVDTYSVAEYSNAAANSQESRMIRKFSELVQRNAREECWGEYALKTQQVLDACWASSQSQGQWLSVS